MNLTHAYLDGAAFKTAIDKDNLFFKTLMTKLGIAR